MKYITSFTIDHLKFNSIAGLLFQAIWLIESKIKLEEQSWDGLNYNVSDTSGNFGTFSFINDKEMVGVSFDKKSEKNPFNSKSNSDYDYHLLFKEVPENIVKFAEQETLQYMLQDFNGKELSIITSVMWSENKMIMTNEPWDSAWENGLSILEKHLLPINKSMQAWKEYYGLTDIDKKWVFKLVKSRLNKDKNFLDVEKEFLNLIKAKKPVQNGIELFEKHYRSMDNVFLH